MEEFVTAIAKSHPEIKDMPGYKGYLNNSVVTMAQMLKDNGYDTYMAGKWHLGKKPGSWPVDKGFSKSMALLEGGATQLGQPRPMMAPPYTATLVENDKKVTVGDDWYSSTGFTNYLLKYLKEGENDGKPFLAYLAFQATHDPLQVPKKYSDKYKGDFDKGYDVARTETYQRMAKMGLISGTEPIGAKSYAKWTELSPREKQRQARSMEIYAGMLDCMDEQIGRVIDYLKESGQYENTMIVFFSDNGAAADYLGEYGPMDDGPDTQKKFIEENFDLSYENMGNANSMVSVGPGWAQASMVPFRLWKGTTAEGGIRTPTIIKWAGINQAKVGTIDTTAVGHILDFAPTLYQMLGLKYPATYNGNDIKPLTGASMLPYLEGKTSTINEALAWELHFNKGLRYKNWKLYWVDRDTDKNHWELYDLSNDAGETKDLSKQYPEVFQQMIQRYEEYKAKNKVLSL